MKSRITFAILAAVFVSIVAGAQPTKEQALKDWAELVRVYDETHEQLDKYHGGYIYENDAEAQQKALTEYAAFEKEKLPKIKAVLDTFSATYGTSPGAIENVIFPLVKGDRPNLRNAGSTYQEMQRGYTGASALRANMGKKLYEEALQTLDHIQQYAEGIRAKKYAEVKKTLELAAQFDPANKEVAGRLRTLESETKAAAAAIEKERDERTWPGHFKGFAGPGDVKTLVKAARQYLENAPDWGANEKNPAEIVAIAVKGNWWSVEKNVLGETTEWGLPVYVALVDKYAEPGNVRVFELSMCTSDNKKQPPFVGVAVGDSWVMRRANVAGGGSGGGGGRGYVGMLLWLALVLANLVAGLLAAAPVLQPKVPALTNVYAALAPQRALIGFVVVIVALVVLVRNLLCLAPFADLLPILAALAAGIVLGKEMVMGVLAGTKAGTVAAEQQGRIAVLEGVQVPLGLACLALGVLHLLVGGWWLV